MKQNKPTTKPKTTTPKVFDVSKPGGSAPNSSARPLIVTHRPMVQDPMMTTPPADDPMAPAQSAPEVPKTVLKPQKIKLQPSPEAIQELAEQAAAEKDTAIPAVAPEPPKSPIDTLLEDEPKPDVKADVSHPVEPTVADGSTSTPPSVDAVPVTVKNMQSSPVVAETPTVGSDTSAPASKLASDVASKVSAEQAAAKDAEAETERKEQSEQIIDSRKYYVHIASPTKKRSMHLAVVGAILIILVAIACVDAMLDAGVLNISGLPHTNFIK